MTQEHFFWLFERIYITEMRNQEHELPDDSSWKKIMESFYLINTCSFNFLDSPKYFLWGSPPAVRIIFIIYLREKPF